MDVEQKALFAGIIALPGMILQLLDEAKVVPLSQSIEFLKRRLKEAPPETLKNGGAFALQIALLHAEALAEPPDPNKPRKTGWTPIVFPGGKD